MAAIGGLLIIAGILAVRQVAVGRARNLPSDTGEFFSAILAGDYAKVTEIGKRRGENG